MKYLKSFLIICLLMAQGLTARAQTQVPHRFHFQSVFYDAGGNPLPSGLYLSRFTLLDQSRERVYAEEQEVELVNGVLSIMVGDGFEEGSNLTIPTGGITRGLISPNQTYYLEAEIEGDSRVMEIGSVPYAHFSEEALSVTPGAVDGTAIAERSILREHLSEILEEAIFGNIPAERIPDSVASNEDFQAHVNDVSGAHPASAISASGPFANSNASSVEDTLKDLDRSVELVGHNIDNLQSTLETQISSVNTNLLNQIATVQGNIDAERSERTAGDNALQGQINERATINYVNTEIERVRADLTPTPSESVIQPQVAAAGIINSGSVSWGYNVNGASCNPHGCCVSFSNGVSTPYVIQATIVESDQPAFPVVISEISSSRFCVGNDSSNWRGNFHFVVYR